MTPALRLSLSLVISLLLWMPTLPSALALHDAPETIALRYLLALVVARIGVGLVFRVIRGYAEQVLAAHEAAAAAAAAETDAKAVADAEEEFGRRRDDLANEEQMLDDALEDAHEAAVLTP